MPIDSLALALPVYFPFTLLHTHTGGVFSRQAEVTFQPGNERLTIKQDFKGIDEHDHLVVSTELEGRLPEVPRGSSVQIDPYKEIYQYTTNRKVIPSVLFWNYF